MYYLGLSSTATLFPWTHRFHPFGQPLSKGLSNLGSGSSVFKFIAIHPPSFRTGPPSKQPPSFQQSISLLARILSLQNISITNVDINDYKKALLVADKYNVSISALVINPEGEIENMFSYIDEEVLGEVYSKIRIPSMMTHDRTYLGTTKQLVKWKKKFSERQVKNILKVVHWFSARPV
ncbi:MAG: hypothetical protein DRP15_01620 [Candidatus Aenigmatarchaeota archaeon]|nr:MAG: hypothetical protein DRP15_01620 [Candidatus Aenigmarchaeota archaeon]